MQRKLRDFLIRTGLASGCPLGSRCGTKGAMGNCPVKSQREDITMKTLIICVAALSFAFSTGAEAKGCIKGAIVGGLAGHFVGHGKVGAVAGCVIGHHEANKADANRTDQRRQPANGQDNRI
jgi:hypothetical protein